MIFFSYWLVSTVTKSPSIITGADLHRCKTSQRQEHRHTFLQIQIGYTCTHFLCKPDHFLGCSESGSSSSSSEETIPDFPPLTTPLPSPVGSPRITGEGGSAFSVGDVVWGKIQGFPWWPGKVVTNIRLPDYHQYLKRDSSLT